MIDHEQRLARLQKQFHGLRIMGGEGVSVHGSPAKGYVVDVKPGLAQSGAPGPTTGACCIGTNCFVLTSADCATMGGVYQGDGVACDPNPCSPCASQVQVILADITICPCVDDRSYDFTLNGTYTLNLDSGDSSGCTWIAAFFGVGTVTAYPPSSGCTGTPDVGSLDTEIVVEFISSSGEWLIHYEDQARSAIFFESSAMSSGVTFTNDNTVCGDPATQFGPPAIQTGTGGTAMLTIL